MSACLIHLMMRELYFNNSIVRIAFITKCSVLKRFKLWKRVLSYPLLLLGIFIYIICMYYFVLVIAIICNPINIYV